MRHKVGKGLMTSKGPVNASLVQRLVTHKDYAVEMVNSIIKVTDMDPCGEHASKDLGASGPYDLSRVRTHHFYFDILLCIHPNFCHSLLLF